jgi:hypothetical protein
MIPVDLHEPEKITTAPIHSNFRVSLWKNLWIDIEASLFFIHQHLSPTRPEPELSRTRSEPIFPTFSNPSFDPDTTDLSTYDVIVCLLPWSEMGEYHVINYPDNVQKSGKILIHFPIHQKSVCSHSFIYKSKCRQMPCGKISPFLDMRAVTMMINQYMNMGLKVLIYCQQDRDRMLLFQACCMIQGEVLLEDVLQLMQQYTLKKRYQTYIKAYADYIQQIR